MTRNGSRFQAQENDEEPRLVIFSSASDYPSVEVKCKPQIVAEEQEGTRRKIGASKGSGPQVLQRGGASAWVGCSTAAPTPTYNY